MLDTVCISICRPNVGGQVTEKDSHDTVTCEENSNLCQYSSRTLDRINNYKKKPTMTMTIKNQIQCMFMYVNVNRTKYIVLKKYTG